MVEIILVYLTRNVVMERHGGHVVAVVVGCNIQTIVVWFMVLAISVVDLSMVLLVADVQG